MNTKTPLRFYSRAVFKLLSELPLAETQYFTTRASDVAVMRAHLLPFPYGAAWRFHKALRLNALNRFWCVLTVYVSSIAPD
jgi:hypothetical protein